MTIAENIRNLRESHGMSQAEFGAIAGVSDKAVSTWEKGIKTPRMGAIQKLADYFGIRKSDIIEDNSDLLGTRIKRMRILREMTQEELAEKIGVQKSAIAKYESGRVVNLKWETLQALASALGVSPAWLFGMEEAQPQHPVHKLPQEEEDLLQLYRNAEPLYQKFAVEILRDHPKKM